MTGIYFFISEALNKIAKGVSMKGDILSRY